MKDIMIKDPQKELGKMLENVCGLTAYKATLDKGKIGTEAYRDNYVSYYQVRRDEAWLAEYFRYMQEQTNNPEVTFEEIFKHISAVEHNTKNGPQKTKEPSFASKMLATLNPNYPIWDKHVTNAVGITYNHSRTAEDYIALYDELTDKVHAFLRTNEGKKYIEEFDKIFPNCTHISPVKKLDVYLWKKGK